MTRIYHGVVTIRYDHCIHIEISIELLMFITIVNDSMTIKLTIL